MTTTLIRAIDEKARTALASGALQPLVTEEARFVDDGLEFVVRWVSSLAKKDASGGAAAVPGGPRDPSFNPFLSPEPALTLGPLGDSHVAILNKFPVCERHLVIATRQFEEQQEPLDQTDFTALALIMTESGGLGFCNAGTMAGASQRHKHVQWVPDAANNPGLGIWLPGLPAQASALSMAQHPKLGFAHRFVRIESAQDTPAARAAQGMLDAYTQACEALGLRPDADGLLPPYNMLAGDGWLLVVPRLREHFDRVSVNALAYGGAIYARERSHIDAIREAGPLRVLRDVSCP